MKTKILLPKAWAIVWDSKRWGTRLALFNGQVPVYWNRKVAELEAEVFGGRVVRVKITEEPS